MLGPRQRANLQVVLYRVGQRAAMREQSVLNTRRMSRMCVATILVESNAWIYANSNIQESLIIYYEKVGTDHASVGLYQQQVPAWGTVEACMDPIRSTDKFINRGLELGVMNIGCGVLPWDACQRIQVSAYPERYKQAWPRAMAVVAASRGSILSLLRK